MLTRSAWLILPALLAAAAGSPAGQEKPTFPVETRVVALDVVATDRDGRPLDDLRRDELQVFENGRPCETSSFRAIGATPSGNRTAPGDAAARDPAPAPSSARPPVFPAPARPNLIVLFFDRLTVESGPLARRGALDFLAGDFPTQTRFAVFSGASRQFAVPFTTDLAAVRKGVEAATFGSTAGAGVTAEAARPAEGQQGLAEPGDSAPAPLAPGTSPSAVRESSARQLASELDTIFAIEGVAGALEGLEARKLILYFAEGWQFSLGVRPQYEAAISAATRANVTVHTFDARGLAYRKLVVVAPLDRVLEGWSAEHHEGPFGGRSAPLTDDKGTGAERLAGPNLEELAADTGGRATANANDLRSALAGISEELRHYYEVVYVPADPTDDGRFRRISVKVSRPGVRIHTRKGYFATVPPSRSVVEEKPPLVIPDDPAPAELGEGRTSTADASLVPILERAARYVAGYEESFRNLIAEEDYSQSVFVGLQRPAGGTLLSGSYRTRRTRADLVFVPHPGDVPWTLFRDVFEVDGREVRDRDRRLQLLFEKPSQSTVDQAQRIVEESARYNIGGAARTINVPTLPLVFLLPRNQLRFSFVKDGQRWISGVEAVEIRFEEIVWPTMVTTSSGESLPARGRFWVDSSRGVVLRSEVVFRFEPSLAEATVETDYQRQPRLGLWVPVVMKERYRNLPHASRSVFGAPTEATARYSNFRQFTVTVEDGKAELDPGGH